MNGRKNLKNSRQAGKMKQILAVAPKPDFMEVGIDIAEKAKSPFTDENWLAGTIAIELERTWNIATRTEEERIKNLCIKHGRMDMFGRWKD